MRHRDIIDVHQPARPFYNQLGKDVFRIRDGFIRKGAISEAAQMMDDMLGALQETAPKTPHNIWKFAFQRSLSNAPKSRAWKARALHLDATDPHMSMALSGMAPIHDGERWMLGVAFPSPPPFGPLDQEITDIIMIDPKTGAASLHGDVGSSLVAPLDTQRFTVHADARTWAREQATARIEWFYRSQQAHKVANVPPIWTGYPDSALLIGKADEVQWPKAIAITAGVGIDHAALKKLMFKQARIPHVEAQLHVRAA